MKARYVIHTVGPVWEGGTSGEDQLLANCYQNSLQLANNISLKSIAFPAISTGVYRFPIDRACRIALESLRDYLKSDDSLNEIYFMCLTWSEFKNLFLQNFDTSIIDSGIMCLSPDFIPERSMWEFFKRYNLKRYF